MPITNKSCCSKVKILKAVLVASLATVSLIVKQNLWAEQISERSGPEVVEVVCSVCHEAGSENQAAPKIGDVKAWSMRASQGLSVLAEHAITGIRKMPSHGGNLGVTDFEIKRAVTYMINQSGGSWTQPLDKTTSLTERSGKQVVQTQCAKCHQTGESGAPRIGDTMAWLPRIRYGFDRAVRSAINGHGAMPPRGGLVNLTDAEIFSAILYMYHPASIPKEPVVVRTQEFDDPYHKVIGRVAIYLGIAPTKSVSVKESAMHGGIPTGKGYYHVGISLQDSETEKQIIDAQVQVTVNDPVMGGRTKQLEVMAIGNTISYGNYFQLIGWDSYSITVSIQGPTIGRAITTNFQIPLT